jgi:hypothetical protein
MDGTNMKCIVKWVEVGSCNNNKVRKELLWVIVALDFIARFVVETIVEQHNVENCGVCVVALDVQIVVTVGSLETELRTNQNFLKTHNKTSTSSS